MANKGKPRVFQDGRDMLINVVVIVVLMLVGVGATGLCTYNPGTPKNGPVQEVDAETFLGMEARATNFPVRFPQAPEGWVTNSARRTMIDGQPAPVVGWVTKDGGFLQLTQTGADLDTAVASVDGKLRPEERTEQVDGHEVRILLSDDADTRPIWALDAGDARFILTGAGTDAEFTELVRAALQAQPLQ